METTRFDGPVTILGASGAIGRALAEKLSDLSPFTPSRTELDKLSDRSLGTIFYCIGKTINFSVDPAATIEAHVNILSRLLREARFDRLIYFSSTRLYDDSGVAIATEETPSCLSSANARHLYDLTKLLGEHLCRHDPKKRAIIARISNVYGLPTSGLGGFLTETISRCLDQAHLSLTSHFETARDYLYLDDLIDMVIAIAADPGEFDLYNLAAGEKVTNTKLLKTLSEKTGCRIDCRAPDGVAPTDPPQVDISRFKQRYGFGPRSFDSAIETLFGSIKRDD
jgi:UDP-glucose 4-epimerase